MRKFVAKIEFSAEDMGADSFYNRIVSAVEDEFGFPEADKFRMVLIPDGEITEADFDAENEFSDWVGTLIHKFDQKLQ